jgi:hypothetical protein
VDNPNGLNRSPSDVQETYVIASQSLTKLSSPNGVRIGELKHNGHSFEFQISGKDKFENDFTEIYGMLSTFTFTK